MSASINKTCLSNSNKINKYLLQFANEHVDFRHAEIKAISELFGFTAKPLAEDKCSSSPGSPYLMVELNSEKEARNLMSRTVLIKSLYEVWGHGATYKEVAQQVETIPAEIKKSGFSAEKTFRINVDTYNKKITQEDKIKIIESLPEDIFSFKGKVNLKNPDNTFGLLEYYGANKTEPPDKPFKIYFGRLIADGQRDLIQQFHLTKRHFIGNTSMDAGLSLIMSNLGQVKQNSVVFDPFVGTGSLLVACAHHGGYVMGTDIDYLLLHAKARPSRHNQKERLADESIHSNLSQYGLGHHYLDILVADSSKHKMWRCQPMYDAIITDPPYGIREGAKRIGTEKDDCLVTDDVKNGHIPQRVEYQMADIFKDLLNFAARFLNMNGRVVFWFPVSRESYTEDNLPTHPCLRLDSNCEQTLSTRISRRLITMVKCKEFKDEDMGTAQIPVDHYDNKPFRDLYYKNSQSNTQTVEDTLKTTSLNDT
ncbi:tRNA (guanine(10)-N2)-methyltransferase homolog [Mytilus trossulus]|uniref:tRNA (guanine(10)-N2)-methyltransferase homolog n=1 Tax=Mytilus trossulus TaxID=6551 RepID=UPI00300593EA